MFAVSQTFVAEVQLEAHMSLHFLSVGAEFRCTSCDKTFGKPDELQKHLVDIHAHHLYRCALCREIYDSKVNIQVRDVMTRIRAYKSLYEL